MGHGPALVAAHYSPESDGDYDRWGLRGWSDGDLAPLVDYVVRTPSRHVGPDDELAAWSARSSMPR